MSEVISVNLENNSIGFINKFIILINKTPIPLVYVDMH